VSKTRSTSSRFRRIAFACSSSLCGSPRPNRPSKGRTLGQRMTIPTLSSTVISGVVHPSSRITDG
jgi:hypothetical protein